MAAPPEPITPPRAHSLDSEGPELGEKGSTEDDSSASPAVSWMLRVRSRNDELKRFFGLPPTENLLDEFHCALRWRILLQGRMYVFDRYVCFYSNVFGYLKNKSIALQDVIAVKKKTHFRFPNSVELDCRDGNRYFFTSFLSRDEAYRLITNAWHQCSDIRQDNSSEEGTLSMSTSSPPSLSAPNTRRALSVNIPSLDNPAHDGSVPVSTRSERRVFFGVGSVRTPGGPRQHPQQQALQQTISEGSGLLTRGVDEFLGESRGTLLTDHDRDEDDGISEDDSNEDKLFASCNPTDPITANCSLTDPPAPHKEYKLLFNYELPCTPREFYARFLCNNSHFFEECHEAAGDKRVILSSWRRDEQLGLVRDLSFVTPIKSAFANWGTAQTQCYQTQRISCYSNQTLVLETSQNMTDIPYGDCFSVDMYIKIAPTAPAAGSPPSAAPTSSSVQAHLRVNFTRKCLFKRIIDSGTQKECVTFYTDLFNRARDALENPNSAAPPAANGVSTPTYHGPSGSPTAAPPGDKQQPGHQRMPSLPSMDHSTLAYANPGQAFGPASVAGDAQGGHAMGRGMFGLHPAVLLMLVTSLLLQVVLLVAWLRPAVPAAAVYTAPQHWLQRLAALQEESRLLQARMDLVAKEASATMQQLQQQFLSPT